VDSRLSKSIILFGLIIIGIILYSTQVNAEGCCITTLKTCTAFPPDYSSTATPYTESTCTADRGIWLGEASCDTQSECALQCCCNDITKTPQRTDPLIKNSTICANGFSPKSAGTGQKCNQACGVTPTTYTLLGNVNSTNTSALGGVDIYVNGIYNTTTEQNGNYSFFNIGVGPYSVTAFKDGCGIEKKDVTIYGNGQIAWANFTLNCTRCTSSPANPCSTSTRAVPVTFTCPDRTFTQNIFCGQTTNPGICNNGTFEKGEWCEKINGQNVNLCPQPFTCNVNDCTKCTIPTAPPQGMAASCKNGIPNPNEQCDFNSSNPSINFSTCKNKTQGACNLDICQCKPEFAVCDWNITYTATGWNTGCCAATDYQGISSCLLIKQPDSACVASGRWTPQQPSVADLKTQYAQPACTLNNIPPLCGNGKIDGTEQCDFNMSGTPPYQEDINKNLCANINPAGCIVNTCQCKLNTYACDWVFDKWTECTGQQFQRALYNDSSDPQCTKPGAYYATARPEITQLCPNFSPACGNGLRNESEKCDFNVTTGKNFSDCINPTNISTCNTEICKCFALPPPPLPDCAINPGNITLTKIGVKYREKNITMNWTVNNTCQDYIKNFKIYRCDNTTGGCTLDRFLPVIPKGMNVPKTNRSFNDDTINMERNYCYFVQVNFNESVNANETPKNSSIRCTYSGDQKCLENPLNQYTKCRDDGVSGTELCDQNNTYKNTTCDSGKFCTRDPLSGNATCKSANKFCDACNGFYAFSMFGTQGFNIYNQTSPLRQMQCPMITDPNRFRNDCYIDYSMAIVDKVYSCGDVTNCYSYRSQTDCAADPCNRFTVGKTPPLINLCEWKPYVPFGNPTMNIFGKGVCRPNSASIQDCSACEDNTIGPKCTKEICSLYGECYSTTDCKGASEVVCNEYNNSRDCTGGVPVDVNVVWNGENLVSGTNRLIKASNDSLTFKGSSKNLGRCKWTTTDKCFKDADNDEKEDCDGTTYPSCSLDNKPPVTTIQNQSIYGKIMDLTGRISVIDNSGRTLGQCSDSLKDCLASDTNNLYLLYNINAGTSGSYPNKFINPNDPTIDLEAMFSNLDEATTYTFSYFAVDAAHNLEEVKNFTFRIDTQIPNISINIIQRSFKPSSNQAWRTNLTINVTLIKDASLPVICELTLQNIPKGWEVYNLDSTTPEDKRQLRTNGSSILTTYPGLPDEEYELETTCRDDAGNTFTNKTTINIEADTRISNVTPRWKTFSNITKPYSMNITTNTSAIECRYSEKTDKYVEMNTTNRFTATSSTNTSWYAPLQNIVNDSRIYRFFVACNFTQGIVEQVPGDEIIFAIDDIAPQTIVIDGTSAKLYLSDFSNSQSLLKLRFNVTNDYWKLWYSPTKNMNFAMNSTWWCLQGTMKNIDRCKNPPNNYTNYSDSTTRVGSIITLDYNSTATDNWNNITGSNPQICYYSRDQGNNTEPVQCMDLSVKNPLFLGPTITIIPGTE